MFKPYLVEIHLKDWIPGNNRIVDYVEVLAENSLHARYLGIDEFERRIQYCPVTKRKWKSLGLTTKDICAPDSVELDY